MMCQSLRRLELKSLVKPKLAAAPNVVALIKNMLPSREEVNCRGVTISGRVGFLFGIKLGTTAVVCSTPNGLRWIEVGEQIGTAAGIGVLASIEYEDDLYSTNYRNVGRNNSDKANRVEYKPGLSTNITDDDNNFAFGLGAGVTEEYDVNGEKRTGQAEAPGFLFRGVTTGAGIFKGGAPGRYYGLKVIPLPTQWNKIFS